MIPIYVGYDPREPAAFHACVSSIIRHASEPVSITPLALNTLTCYAEAHRDGSNQFTYSRFLVPHLAHYSGHAIYLDGDMIVKRDIAELWALRRPDMAVQVVQHDYKTKQARKYLGAPNADYPRKNWSSVIIWNCAHMPNRKLTPEYVAAATGAHLHRFEWLDAGRVGALPMAWNHLVGEYPHNDDAALLHYTLGTPCFDEYASCDHAADWHQERQVMNSCDNGAYSAADVDFAAVAVGCSVRMPNPIWGTQNRLMFQRAADWCADRSERFSVFGNDHEGYRLERTA